MTAPRTALLLPVMLALALAPTAAFAGEKGKSDPAGNNGTFMVASVPADKAHGNQPHPGCSFALRFYGFDADQHADITFLGQAPTRTGTLLAEKGVLISDDAAGGGQDADAVRTYTADALGLSAVPRSRNGWHVKVSVDALEAPGGAKHKVFWLDCPAPAPSAQPTTTTTTTTTTTGTTTTTTTPTQPAVAPAPEAQGSGSGVSAAGAGAPTVTTGGTQAVTAPTSSGGASTFTGGSGTVSASSTGGAVLGRGLALPLTGGDLATAGALALAAVAGGGAMVVAGHRRRGLSGR